jgi:hypothetical protein
MLFERKIWKAAALGLLLFLVWTVATYVLEGRVLALQRPEAIGARTTYALVANILIGIGGSALLLRALSRRGVISLKQAGFRGFRHAAVAVLIGAVLGFVVYLVQGAPSLDPLILLNVYAQVLVVSIAEVLVCWAVMGSISESLVNRTGRWAAPVIAAFIASTLFGLYHLAHSPPFNTLRFVVLLTVVGLVTSIFFFLSRDVYGTIVFHTFLGIVGVAQALERSNALRAFERPVIPLLAMAAAAILLLVAVNAFALPRKKE